MKRINPELRELTRVVYTNGREPTRVHVMGITDTSYVSLILAVGDTGLHAHGEISYAGPRYANETLWHGEGIGMCISPKLRAIADWLDYYGFDLSRWEVIQ